MLLLLGLPQLLLLLRGLRLLQDWELLIVLPLVLHLLLLFLLMLLKRGFKPFLFQRRVLPLLLQSA